MWLEGGHHWPDQSLDSAEPEPVVSSVLGWEWGEAVVVEKNHLEEEIKHFGVFLGPLQEMSYKNNLQEAGCNYQK